VEAITALLVLQTMLVAPEGCHRPPREELRPTNTTAAREGGADAPVQAERAAPSAASPDSAREDSPARPAPVPADAFWVGGPDGGVFVRLERTPGDKGNLSGKIYHPDGELWYAGPLVPRPPGTSVDPARHDQFDGWDGERLLMTEGRWLESVKRGAPRPH